MFKKGVKKGVLQSTFIFVIGLVALMAQTVFAQPSTAQQKPNQVNFKNISTQTLTEGNQAWFMKAFPRSFMSVYTNKTFVITKQNKPTVLGPKNKADKQKWLEDTAKDEFENYVLKPKPGYKAILIEYKKKPIGTILYRLLDKEKTIYVAQYFIMPEYQKKGIGKYLLAEALPKLHPEYTRYEILARHQNDAAFLLYDKSGFSFGDIDIVKKYDYDPLRYMSFFKDIK